MTNRATLLQCTLGSSAAFRDRSAVASRWLCGGGLLLFVDVHGASFQL